MSDEHKMPNELYNTIVKFIRHFPDPAEPIKCNHTKFNKQHVHGHAETNEGKYSIYTNITRLWPIMLKFLPIMFLSNAQKSSLLCSILCYHDYA